MNRPKLYMGSSTTLAELSGRRLYIQVSVELFQSLVGKLNTDMPSVPRSLTYCQLITVSVPDEVLNIVISRIPT